MVPTFLTSANLATAGWEEDTLFLVFKGGDAYRYDAVPHSVFAALCAAESSGQFFHRFIRSKYAYKKLEHNPFERIAA